jgi:hypothetical protein
MGNTAHGLLEEWASGGLWGLGLGKQLKASQGDAEASLKPGLEVHTLKLEVTFLALGIPGLLSWCFPSSHDGLSLSLCPLCPLHLSVNHQDQSGHLT